MAWAVARGSSYSGVKETVSELDSMLKSCLHLWKTQESTERSPRTSSFIATAFPKDNIQKSWILSSHYYARLCTELYPPLDTKKVLPHITIVIVGKRHYTRFYPTTATTAGDADRSSNPKNGTIVDRGVTEARNWDFSLQPQTALQGIARPAHYYIVLDEIFAKRKVPPPISGFFPP